MSTQRHVSKVRHGGLQTLVNLFEGGTAVLQLYVLLLHLKDMYSHILEFGL